MAVFSGSGSWPSPFAISRLPRIGEWPVCRPVISDARDGAQTLVPLYACVNRVPSAARRSSRGVWISFCP